MTDNAKIIYTWTDEAPALATLSFLPIIQAFTSVLKPPFYGLRPPLCCLRGSGCRRLFA